MAERPYCGPEGDKIVDQMAAELIADAPLRQRWTEFDQQFLRHCVEGSDLGLVFSRQGFAELADKDQALLQLGIKIYNAAGQEAVRQRSTSYRALNILAIIYLSASRTCQ